MKKTSMSSRATAKVEVVIVSSTTEVGSYSFQKMNRSIAIWKKKADKPVMKVILIVRVLVGSLEYEQKKTREASEDRVLGITVYRVPFMVRNGKNRL